MVNLFDFNNLAIRCFFARDVEAKTQPNIDLWRYFVVNNICSSLFKDYVDEVILAVDGKNSWRKIYWNRYKETRKTKKDKIGINWNFYYSEFNKLILDIKKSFPFKIIRIDKVEADDIIAILSEKESPVTIISTDEDFLQLSSKRVKIFNPIKQKFVHCIDPEKFVIEKCLLGQPKDDIFNIKTPLDWSGKRKPGFGRKALERVMSSGYEKWLKENKLEKRFRTNRILIDFKKIPPTIRKRIIDNYEHYILPKPGAIYNFFDNNIPNDFYKCEQKMLELF